MCSAKMALLEIDWQRYHGFRNCDVGSCCCFDFGFETDHRPGRGRDSYDGDAYRLLADVGSAETGPDPLPVRRCRRPGARALHLPELLRADARAGRVLVSGGRAQAGRSGAAGLPAGSGDGGRVLRLRAHRGDRRTGQPPSAHVVRIGAGEARLHRSGLPGQGGAIDQAVRVRLPPAARPPTKRAALARRRAATGAALARDGRHAGLWRLPRGGHTRAGALPAVHLRFHQ